MQKNYKSFINLIVIITVIVFLVIHFAFRAYDNGSSPWQWEGVWGDIGYTSGIVFVLAVLFNCLLWRIPFIGRCLHTPNLNGTWEGKGKSSHEGVEYSFTVKINQSFLETHIHGFFEKSQSDSFGSVFIHNETIDRTVLVYSYQNDPNLEYRNKAEKGQDGGLSIHYGTTKLDIDYDDLNKLSGTYWNDRECTGCWQLIKQNKNGKQS